MEDAPRRLRLLGAEVDTATPAQVLARAAALTTAGRPAVIANHNAHSLFLLRRSAALRAFFEGADLIQIDSTPMILWGRLLGLPVSRAHRSTYLDWREDFWRLATTNGWKVFHLGGAPGVGAKAATEIARRWPGVQLAEHHGYFDADPASPDSAAVRAQIAAFDPDIVFVGMGMPRQEAWIAANLPFFKRGVFFPVGAAFDYEAGVQTKAPRWMGPLGIEWLFRLVSQPRRLAFRYLVEPWFLLPSALSDVRGALTRVRA